MYLAMLQNPTGGANPLMFQGGNMAFNQGSINSLLGMGSMPSLGSFGQMGMGSGPNQGNSAASFHQPAEKNQIKLFVGGLAFHTHENDLNKYFS